MGKPLKIFISGPLTNGGQASNDEVLKNMEKAVLAGIECIKKGHYPFIPHLDLITHKVAKEQGFEIPWQTWMNLDDAFLVDCDAILWLGSSKGSEIEKARAKELGLKVYISVDDIPEVVPFVESHYKDSPY